MAATDWLTKQGWSKADAEKYVSMQEQGKTPTQAYQTVKGQDNKVIEVFEPKSEDEEYAIEPKLKSVNEKLFGRKITTDEIENAAGKVIGKAQKGVESVAEDLKRRGQKVAKEQKEIDDTYREAFTSARIEAIRNSARSAGRRAGGGAVVGGLSVAKRPKPAVISRSRYEMKAPPIETMTKNDMGMGEILDTGGDPVGEFKVGGGYDVHMGKAPSINRIVNTNLSNPPRVRTKTNPVNDNRSESLVSLGNVRNPVNVDNRAVSTRIPRTEKVSVKFKGRKPKTATQKPIIRTQLVTEKKFWEI